VVVIEEEEEEEEENIDAVGMVTSLLI